MDQKTIDLMKIKGFTYIGCINGKSLFCNLNSEESIKEFIKYLNELTGKEWGVFDEIETALITNKCFYRKDLYTAEVEGLVYSGDGSEIDLPLHCSSCYNMFQNVRFTADTKITNFDTSNVKTMNSMFTDCIFKAGFVFPKEFKFGIDTHVRFMFSQCKFQSRFRLPQYFNIADLVMTSFMFYMCDMGMESTLPVITTADNVIDFLKTRN